MYVFMQLNAIYTWILTQKRSWYKAYVSKAEITYGATLSMWKICDPGMLPLLTPATCSYSRPSKWHADFKIPFIKQQAECGMNNITY
jgi:hypothetical protein